MATTQAATRGETRAQAADLAAQERADVAAPPTPVTSTRWVRAVHPDHGEAVVYVPGETLPAWVAQGLPDAATDPTDERILIVDGH